MKLPPSPRRKTTTKQSTNGGKANLHKQEPKLLPDIQRILPQSPEAEQGALCSFLFAPREVGALFKEKSITKEHFHLTANQIIFEAMMELWDDNKDIDLIIVTQLLHDRKKLDQAGGAAYITQISTRLGTAHNAPAYLEILIEKYILREGIKVATEFATRLHEEQDDSIGLMAEFETRLLGISTRHTYSEDDYEPTRAIILRAVEKIQKAIDNKGQITGISTGFLELDRLTDGLQRKEVFVIAALPAIGKTAIAMNIMEHIAINLKIPVGIFSLEMSRNQLIQRAIMGRARINWAALRTGVINEKDSRAIAKSASDFGSAPMHFNDHGDSTPAYINAVTRRWVREFGIQAVMIDYLQMIRGTKRYKGSNRESEVAEISRDLKYIAKENNVAVVVLAQLNREAAKRGESGGVPRLSDLRESGAIEADADVVGLLHREEAYIEDEEKRKEVAGKADLHIAKQRNGPVGHALLTFIREITRFENRAIDEVSS
jgi:replicative DNA helicase